MKHVCDIKVIENNRYMTIGCVAWCSEALQFMFRSALSNWLEYETIDSIPDRILNDVLYGGDEFFIAPVSLDHIGALKLAVEIELAKRIDEDAKDAADCRYGLGCE